MSLPSENHTLRPVLCHGTAWVPNHSYSGSTIVLSKKDQDILTSHYRKGISLKGALLLSSDDLDKKIVLREDTFFLDQIEKDKSILKKLSPPLPENAAPWDY